MLLYCGPNSEVRKREGYGANGDLVIGFNEHFEVEWGQRQG